MEALNNYATLLLIVIIIPLWITCCPLKKINLPPLSSSATFEEKIQYHKVEINVLVQQQLCWQHLSAKGLQKIHLSTADFTQICPEVRQFLTTDPTIANFLDMIRFHEHWGELLFVNNKKKYVLNAFSGGAGEVTETNHTVFRRNQALIDAYLGMNYDIMFNFINCDLNGYYFGYRPDTLVVYKYVDTQLVPLSFEEFKKEVL